MGRPKMKKNIIMTTTLVVFVLVITAFLTRPPALRLDLVQNWSPNATPLYGTRVISQTFVPQAGSLSAIGVRFGLYKQVGPGEVEWRLYRLGKNASKTLIATQRVPAATVETGAIRDFVFPAIRDSRGQRFQFTLAAPALTKAAPVAVYLSGKLKFEKPYPRNKTYLSGKDTGQDLDFIAYSSVSNAELVNAWLSHRGRFIHVGATWFIGLLLAGLAIAITMMVGRTWDIGGNDGLE
jgi:hypothetical protein